jgi:hypothetical protein
VGSAALWPLLLSQGPLLNLWWCWAFLNHIHIVQWNTHV